MQHKTTTALTTLVALIALFFGAVSAQAHSELTSDLLLPYFEIDMSGNGVTTFFAVVNSSPEPVRVRMSVYTNWGVEVLSTVTDFKGDEAKTINLTDWVLKGKLLDRTLDAAELEHCQAALTGQRSPADDLYYSTEEDFEKAVGFVVIHTEGVPRPDVLFGDFFVVDGSQDFGQGELLINIDPAADCSGLCERHALRYLLGAGFDEGTQILIWTGRPWKGSSNAFFPDSEKTTAEILIYKQNGELAEERQIGLKPLEVVTVADLGFSPKFGWLDIQTDHLSFMAVRHSAQSRFSVALQTTCMPKRTPQPPGGGGDPTPSVSIDVEKSTNGHDADTAPGPQLAIDDPVLWEYVVTNTGDTALSEVIVTDDMGVAVSCPKNALAAGETMVCTGNGLAVPGQYRNVGTATGKGPSSEMVEDSDPSHYHTTTTPPPVPPPAISIDIEKATNGHDADAAPGPTLLEGDAVTWTYVVTNTGEADLEDVTVTDDMGVAVSCPSTTLAIGQAMTCTGHGTATLGQYRNVGTATGRSSDGQTTDDTDPSHYFGEPEPVVTEQGCTPGYWKNHTDSWPAAGLSPAASVESTFSAASAYAGIGTATLLQALDFSGGSGVDGAARNLLRAAVAALLNASHAGVNYTVAGSQVISDVNAALAGADRASILSLASSLDRENNNGCPLN